MRVHARMRTIGFVAAALTLLAAISMSTAGTSFAQSRDGGWRSGSGYSHPSGSHEYRGGGSVRGGYTPNDMRSPARGSYSRGGTWGSPWGGGSIGYRHYQGYPSRSRYRGGYGYRYSRPRSFLSFSFGVPYYYPRPYVEYVEPYPVYEDPHAVIVDPYVAPESRRVEPAPTVEPGTSSSIDVTNEPPAGCYYYDRFCDKRFSSLDEYTDHLDKKDHPKTVEIIRNDSGEHVRNLVFSGEYWSVEGSADDSE